MKIQLHNVGKRYNRDWVLKHLNYTFLPGGSYAITGPNGSGKSTLLQLLSGTITANEGICEHFYNKQKLPPETIFHYTSLCAPYVELIEEFTLLEFLEFHGSFKPYINQIDTDFIANEVQLAHAKHKKINEYSSGMKQRAKLAQCFFSDTPLILLDEPCTNLDTIGIDLYHYLVQKYCTRRTVVVSSNDKTEYGFCKEVIDTVRFPHVKGG